MKRTHVVIINAPDGTHILGKYCSEQAAVKKAFEWLGDIREPTGKLSWVSMYGDAVRVEEI